MSNEYKPWEQYGITECEYWKWRYLEAREEIFGLEVQLEVIQPPVLKGPPDGFNL